MVDLESWLLEQPLILMDGAMGSELLRLGLKPGECFEAWNLHYPDKVLGIHRAYIEAGAQCLLTNTFQANPPALAKHGLEPQLESICHAAIALARQAAGPERLVIASVGPMALRNNDDVADLKRVIRALQTADAILLETWSEGFELAVRCAVHESLNTTRLPVLLSLTCTVNQGQPVLPPNNMHPAEAARRACPYDLAALGVNCGKDIGLEEMLTIFDAYREVTNLPLLARPNAGTPMERNGTWCYPRTPQEMASWVPKLLDAGVKLLGGCCGTTPEHVAAMHRA